jgi:DHA2 family multidrug resistance protein-like MFS transporter
MGATLAVSLVGYALLATADPGDKVGVVLGFAFVYLGLGAIAALGTDLVVGAAPATRAGSAAALSETVQELGIAVGVALLGSLATAVQGAGREGITTGLNVASLTAGAAILAVTVLCLVMLRHLRPIGR